MSTGGRGLVVTSAGVPLAYETSGPSSAPALVLLHALGESRRSWDVVIPPLTERFHVHAFDLRGHGESGWPGTYSIESMHDDVLDALDHLDLRRVSVMGHSLGGAVAWMAAVTQGGRIERLIVEDAPPPYVREHAIAPRPDHELDFDWTVVPAIVSEVNKGLPDLWDRLGSIRAETLVIAGGPSSHISQERLHAAAQAVPKGAIATIPAGHSVHATMPDRFVDVVCEWLDGANIDPGT